VVLKTLACLKRNHGNALRSKYGLCPYDETRVIKNAVFENFSVAFTMLFYFLLVIFCIFFMSYVLRSRNISSLFFMFYGFNVFCM